jgi:hypothetical protein
MIEQNFDIVNSDIDTEADIIREIREKRKNNNQEVEKISDIFTTQCILCVCLILGIFVANIFAKDFVGELVTLYKDNTNKELENFFVEIAEKLRV